jgi:hypothetical protein
MRSRIGRLVSRFVSRHALLHPRWVAPLFALGAVALAPWMLYLLVTLPDEAIADHWRLAWTGFDAGLALSFVLMVATILYRSPWTSVTASITGTLLVCDAWFDVLTARGRTTVTIALAEALLVELPLAVVCFLVARNFERALESLRPYLRAAGFEVRDGRIMPPPTVEADQPEPDRS